MPNGYTENFGLTLKKTRGFLMINGSIAYYFYILLNETVKNYASPGLVEILKNKLMPQIEADFSHKIFTFQQENVLIHNIELIIWFLRR